MTVYSYTVIVYLRADASVELCRGGCTSHFVRSILMTIDSTCADSDRTDVEKMSIYSLQGSSAVSGDAVISCFCFECKASIIYQA